MMEQTAAFGNEASAESSSLDGHPEHRLADREEPAQFRVRRARLDALPELEPLAPAGRDRPEQECRLAHGKIAPMRDVSRVRPAFLVGQVGRQKLDRLAHAAAIAQAKCHEVVASRVPR